MSKSSRGRGGSGGLPFNEGDWTCAGCNNLNFARRVECNRCGEKKQPGVKKIKRGGVQIGKVAAEKSHGLFSADDWICKTCGNVNWARRSDCNMCNTPKIGVQEERTGFGGGFNERQNVEYKQREQDSDDEYDQYGRLKRRKSQNGNQAWAKKKEDTPQVESDDDAQDDDEDSDEDGDLSKYDLDDDDDDEDVDPSKYDLSASDNDDDDDKSKSRSRSRSSSSRSRSRSPRRKRTYSSSSSEDKSSSHKRHRRSRSNSSSPDRRRRH